MLAEPIDRFIGAATNSLIDGLLAQRIVQGQQDLAEALARVARIEQFPAETQIIKQDHADNDLFLILMGEVSIVINGNEIARRHAGFHVGEMALIDPSAKRSATVIARTITVMARVSQSAFIEIANRHPSVWRQIASELGDRLRQRARFIRTKNETPIMFIGSSRESLPVVSGIVDGLKDAPFIVRPWTDGVFTASRFPIDDLVAQVGESDFAGLVFGPDDKALSRWRWFDAPRDNVILELGLFMGAISRERAFVISPRDRRVKIPSDILGMSTIQYASKASELETSLASVSAELAGLVAKMGAR
jgi:predicted nucleotide-binding protein